VLECVGDAVHRINRDASELCFSSSIPPQKSWKRRLEEIFYGASSAENSGTSSARIRDRLFGRTVLKHGKILNRVRRTGSTVPAEHDAVIGRISDFSASLHPKFQCITSQCHANPSLPFLRLGRAHGNKRNLRLLYGGRPSRSYACKKKMAVFCSDCCSRTISSRSGSDWALAGLQHLHLGGFTSTPTLDFRTRQDRQAVTDQRNQVQIRLQKRHILSLGPRRKHW